MTDEQEQLLDSMGFKGQHKVAAAFFLIALVIVGINVFLRFHDSHRYDDYEHTRGVVTETHFSKIPRTGTSTSYDYIYSIDVEYYADDPDYPYEIHDSSEAYEFFRRGKVLRVCYDEDDPLDAYLMKEDWITGRFVPAEKRYDMALYFSIFPVIIGAYLLVDYCRAVKLAKQGKLKPKKKVKSSKDPDYDPNLHDLARMSGYKRSWSGFWICGSLFYIFTMVMGIMIIVSVVKDPGKDAVTPVIMACFFMLMGNAMLAGVVASVAYLGRKKKAFIDAFMADEATSVYGDREQAAQLLWKLVKKYMQAEHPWSRFKLEYNRDWLETYEEQLEHLKRI